LLWHPLSKISGSAPVKICYLIIYTWSVSLHCFNSICMMHAVGVEFWFGPLYLCINSDIAVSMVKGATQHSNKLYISCTYINNPLHWNLHENLTKLSAIALWIVRPFSLLQHLTMCLTASSCWKCCSLIGQNTQSIGFLFVTDIGQHFNPHQKNQNILKNLVPTIIVT